MNKQYEDYCKRIRAVMPVGVELYAVDVLKLANKGRKDKMTKNAVIQCLGHYMNGIDKRKSGVYKARTRYVRLI